MYYLNSYVWDEFWDLKTPELSLINSHQNSFD